MKLLNLFRYIGLRHLGLQPGRTLLTGSGILLGVALFTGISIINRSTLRSFKESVDAVAGKATLTVTAGETGFPEDVINIVENVPGVEAAVPMVEARAYFKNTKGEFTTLMIFGVDLLKESSVRVYKTENESVIEDPLLFLNQPDSVILTREFSDREKLELEDTISLSSSNGKKTLTVRGMLTPTGPAKAWGGAMAIMDIDGARFTFGKTGKTDRIDIVNQKSVPVEVLKQRLEEKLGKAFRVEEPETQNENMRRMVSTFQAFLSFLSTLALVVGLFLVGNVVAVSITERRREIGVLRALGARRPHILVEILTEIGLISLFASVGGVFAGRLMAGFMVEEVTQAMASQFVTTVAVAKLETGPADIIQGLLIGTVTALLASLIPALRVLKIQPVEALKPKGSMEQVGGKPSLLWRVSPWLGLTFLVFIYIFKVFDLGREYPTLTSLNSILGIVAVALISPSIVVGAIRIIAKLLGRNLVPSAFLALENLLRQPSRTGSNVLSLIVGFTFVIIISVVNISFRQTMIDWANKAFSQGRIIVSANGRLTSFQTTPLHDSLAEKLSTIEGAKEYVFAFRFVRLQYQNTEIGMKAMDSGPEGSGFHFLDVVDVREDEAGKALFHSDAPTILISQTFYKHFGKKTGETITLATPSGDVEFKIGGMINDYANPNGVLYIHRKTYKKFFKDSLVTAFSLTPKEGVTYEQLRKNVNSEMGEKYGLVTTMASELVEDLGRIVDQSFAFNRAIEFAALLVGLLGLLNTLLISVLERTREIGMIRAIGMSRAQLSGMILLESIFQGSLGAFCAAVFGLFLSWTWVTGTMSDLLGWVIVYHIPFVSILKTLGIGITVSILAGWLPAHRAAKMSLREALEYE